MPQLASRVLAAAGAATNGGGKPTAAKLEFLEALNASLRSQVCRGLDHFQQQSELEDELAQLQDRLDACAAAFEQQLLPLQHLQHPHQMPVQQASAQPAGATVWQPAVPLVGLMPPAQQQQAHPQ